MPLSRFCSLDLSPTQHHILYSSIFLSQSKEVFFLCLVNKSSRLSGQESISAILSQLIDFLRLS